MRRVALGVGDHAVHQRRLPRGVYLVGNDFHAAFQGVIHRHFSQRVRGQVIAKDAPVGDKHRLHSLRRNATQERHQPGLNFGGPYVGLFATRVKFVRQMPGRLAGETVDVEGRRGFVLTLSTREQHIRREKATSNICTNSGLCALAFTIHMTLLGEAGLRKLARLNHAHAVALAEKLGTIAGVEVLNRSFFNEFTVRIPGNGAEVVDRLVDKGILGGVPAARLLPADARVADLIVVASTEINTDEDRAAYAKALKEVL